MKRDYTKLIFIISILLTTVSSLFLLNIFKLIINKNISTTKILTTLSKDIAQKNNAKVLIQKSTELEATNKVVSSHFIKSSNVSNFVDSLEKLGRNNNAKLTVLNVAVPQKAKNTIVVKISIVGNFNEVMKTIYLLEDSPFYVNITQAFVSVNKVDIQTKENKKEITKSSKSPNIWEANITFSVLII